MKIAITFLACVAAGPALAHPGGHVHAAAPLTLGVGIALVGLAACLALRRRGS